MNAIPPEVQQWIDTLAGGEAWHRISHAFLTPDIPFDVHLALFTQCYSEWETRPETAVLWQPDSESRAHSQLQACLQESGCTSLKAFHRYSVTEPEAFWGDMLKRLGIRFYTRPEKICDLSQGAEHPLWLPKARMNIVDSCFRAPPDKPAIVQQEANRPMQVFTYGELETMVNRIAGGLLAAGYRPGDAIGLMMPMHFTAVACFLAIIRMGGKVVSIAESFSLKKLQDACRLETQKVS